MSPTRKPQTRAAKPRASEKAAARKPEKAAPKTPNKARTTAAAAAAKRPSRAAEKPAATQRGSKREKPAGKVKAAEVAEAPKRGVRAASSRGGRQAQQSRDDAPPDLAHSQTLKVEPVTAAEPAISLDTPEVDFSSRVTPVVADRPRPHRRRAIFIDVENTSRASQIQQALDELDIDHTSAWTDLVASGNWRVIGNETARILARKGAQLIHSAPATGVRDWSDLRIAVAAGVWLASARPGDTLQLISDDRAFDAVGDVAATLGVEFTRLSYRNGRRGETSVAGPVKREPRREGRAPRAPREETPAAEGQAETRRPRRRRGGRSRSEGAPAEATERLSATPAASEAPAAAPERSRSRAAAPKEPRPDRTAGTAPTEDLLSIVSELLASSPAGVPLDALARRLKELGFSRPPGSPRLVTRVRAIRELAVAPNGVIRLASSPPLAATNGAASPPESPRESSRPAAATRAAPSSRPAAPARPASAPVQTTFEHSGFAPSAPPDFDAPAPKAPAESTEESEAAGEEEGDSASPRRSRRRGGRGRRSKPEQA